MGISLLTAIIIKNSKPQASIQGPNNKGMYSGIIGHKERGHLRIDITTDFCYKTKTEAWKETRAIIKQIKGLDIP